MAGGDAGKKFSVVLPARCQVPWAWMESERGVVWGNRS